LHTQAARSQAEIAVSEPDSFSVGGVAAKATHYVIKIDIGGVTGSPSVAGKQPPRSISGLPRESAGIPEVRRAAL
jgi:hypothetical protein